MSWKLLPDPTQKEIKYITKIFGKKARFIVDENIDGLTTEILHELKWNVKGVKELGLSGHSDEDVLAEVWCNNRMLITNDRDFLDNDRFPEHRNPGIIILPDALLNPMCF